jgi:hypothetical protein
MKHIAVNHTLKQQPKLGTVAYWSLFASMNNGDRSSEIRTGFREGWDD